MPHVKRSSFSFYKGQLSRLVSFVLHDESARCVLALPAFYRRGRGARGYLAAEYLGKDSNQVSLT